jgi:hypothetical protein
MNINPNIDPQSPLQKPGADKPLPAKTEASPSPEQALFQSDNVELSQAGVNRTADTAAKNESIQNDADAAAAALVAAQQIQSGTPDDLYDWSGMTPEKLKELLS